MKEQRNKVYLASNSPLPLIMLSYGLYHEMTYTIWENVINMENSIEWINRLSKSDNSTQKDSETMQQTLRYMGWDKAVCTCGVVYPYGFGVNYSINDIANKMRDVVLVDGKVTQLGI